MYLFDQSNQLQLLDSCQLPHPVLSMTWSQDYTTLAVGADNVRERAGMIMFDDTVHIALTMVVLPEPKPKLTFLLI